MIINIFSAYVEPLLKDINHPELLQEWKLNIDAAQWKKKLILTYLNLLKKETNCHDSDLYWKTPIKDTIRWFTFFTITEHTTNIMKKKSGVIPSLLKEFAMFELRLIGDREKMDAKSGG